MFALPKENMQEILISKSHSSFDTPVLRIHWHSVSRAAFFMLFGFFCSFCGISWNLCLSRHCKLKLFLWHRNFLFSLFVCLFLVVYTKYKAYTKLRLCQNEKTIFSDFSISEPFLTHIKRYFYVIFNDKNYIYVKLIHCILYCAPGFASF